MNKTLRNERERFLGMADYDNKQADKSTKFYGSVFSAFSALFERRIEEDFRVFDGVHKYCMVPYVGQYLQRGVHSGFSQLLVKALALLHWYHSITLAMHDQKRRI